MKKKTHALPRSLTDLDDAELLGMAADEVRAHEAPIAIVLRPLTAVQLSGMLQLALRHPTVADNTRRAATIFLEHVRAAFADAPGVLELMRRGDNPITGFSNQQLADLRRDVTAGAGHECEEWWTADGVCALCDRRRDVAKEH